MHKICFVDVETTGLDDTVHEIIEIAAVLVRGDTLETIGHYSSKIKPLNIDRAHPRALEVNGYNEEDWTNAPYAPEALWKAYRLISGNTLAGHNVAFDCGFIKAAYAKCTDYKPRISHRMLDTISLAWPLMAGGEVKSLSLDSLCEYLNIHRERAHSALDDALASLEVARIMLERYNDYRPAGSCSHAQSKP